MPESNDSIDFATLALAHKLVGRDQLEHCQAILEHEMELGKLSRKLEDIFIEEGILSESEVWAVFKAQSRLSRDAKAAGRRIGGYEILSKVGEGGLGVVYKARQLSMGRIVALKVLHEKWVEDEEFRKRFLVEARLVGRLSHSNLIQVIDVGRYKETYFYSMEFIDGETVEDRVERDGAFPALQAMEIVFQVVRAMQYLSQFNIVHRDIKPGNIMLSKAGVAKLGDFGFVKSNLDPIISSEGEILGTPDYISPEAAVGATDLDFRSDIYSLGATFYHMLAGRPAFDGSPSEVMDKHIKEPLPPLKKRSVGVSDHVCLVVEKMMAKNRDDRYATAAAVFDDLEMLRMDERAALGDAEPGKSTVIHALQRGRLRVVGLLEEKMELEDRVKGLRLWLWISLSIAAALAAVLVMTLQD